MARSEEHTDWLDDAFDDEKNAQLEEELQRARSKSRITLIILLVILAIIVLLLLTTCGAAMFLGSGDLMI